MKHIITAALFIIAISLFNSISVMAIFHVLMVPAIIYVICKQGIKSSFQELPKSTLALIGFCVALILSVSFNQDIISNGFKNASKVKYYLIGALSVIPFRWYYLNAFESIEDRDRMLKKIFTTFIIASCIGTISGLIGFYTGFNPLKFKEVHTHRNGGMFGMLMTYAHQAALLGAILFPLLLNKKLASKFISYKLLIFANIINFYGLFTTYTRGALLAFIAGLFFLNKKIVAAITITGIIGGITLSLTNPTFVKENIMRQDSNEERLGSWVGALYAFKERPILGYGFRNFEPHSRRLKEKYNAIRSYYVGHAHSNFLEILATTGLVGFIFFMCWLILWAKDSLNDGLIATISLCFGATFVTGGLTQSTFTDGENVFFILTFYAIVMVILPKKKLSNP